MAQTVKSFFHSLEEGKLTAKQFKAVGIFIAVAAVSIAIVAALKHLNY